MTFQAYLDNIQKQTGVTPDEFIKLGHGHAMAIVKLLKDRGGLK